MGKCKVSGGLNPPVVGRSLPRQNVPNSRSRRFDEFGDLIQERWYGPDGWVIWNRDYKHQDNPPGRHKFPHDHEWTKNPDTGEPERGGDMDGIDPSFC